MSSITSFPTSQSEDVVRCTERALRSAFVRVWRAQHAGKPVPEVKCVHVKGPLVYFLLSGASSSGMFPGWGFHGPMSVWAPLALAAMCRPRHRADRHRMSDVACRTLAGRSREKGIDHLSVDAKLTFSHKTIGTVPLTALVLRGPKLLEIRAYGLEYPIRGLAKIDAFCDVCCDLGGRVPFEEFNGQGGACPPRTPRLALRHKAAIKPRPVVFETPSIPQTSPEPRTTECELGQASETPRSEVWDALFGG